MLVSINDKKDITYVKGNTDDSIRTISIGFKNGEVMTYGYNDMKSFVKDLTSLWEYMED